jgi:hypothetical protein
VVFRRADYNVFMGLELNQQARPRTLKPSTSLYLLVKQISHAAWNSLIQKRWEIQHTHRISSELVDVVSCCFKLYLS